MIKRVIEASAIGLSLLVALGVGVHLMSRVPFRHEWMPALEISQVRTGGHFVARIDAVRFGYETSVSNSPFKYVVIYVTKEDRTQVGLVEYSPGSNLIDTAKALKEGRYYGFPEALGNRVAKK